MEITISSIKTIKPSFPTSNEHKTYELCLFDTFQLNTYFPLILFYNKTNDMQKFSDVSTQLQKSLSETLSIFYPLCGRKSDWCSIDCNDEGAIYIEAFVNINMEEFLKPPKLELLNKLLPCEPNKAHPQHEILPQLVIQVNKFKCGGIAIGLCNLHIILDACSCSAFLKTWSNICKGCSRDKNVISLPDFSSASSLFPSRYTSGVRAGVMNMNNGIGMEVKCSTRRFLFDTKAINNLKVKVISESDGNPNPKNPTSYQAISSFICKHMIVACMSDSCDEITRPFVVLHVVDMRRRIGEPFSQDSIGNLLWPAVLVLENINENTSISALVNILGDEIKKLTKDLFLRIQNDPSFLWGDECGELMLEGITNKNPISLVFTSWGNMGFKDLDFGWGKPLWLAQRGGTKESIPNSVVLMETYEGIEAWVTMAVKHLDILENDTDFLRSARVNPNISIY